MVAARGGQSLAQGHRSGRVMKGVRECESGEVRHQRQLVIGEDVTHQLEVALTALMRAGVTGLRQG